jgi:3-oxoadipate CoA-transferase beta subunit
VAGVKTILVITQHTTKDGKPKIVENCTYPLTGKAVVNRIYTNLAIMDVTKEGLMVKELAPGISFSYLQQNTGARLKEYK